jgi:hypothetical protein
MCSWWIVLVVVACLCCGLFLLFLALQAKTIWMDAKAFRLVTARIKALEIACNEANAAMRDQRLR